MVYGEAKVEIIGQLYKCGSFRPDRRDRNEDEPKQEIVARSHCNADIILDFRCHQGQARQPMRGAHRRRHYSHLPILKHDPAEKATYFVVLLYFYGWTAE